LIFAVSSSASLETDLSGEWGIWVSESGEGSYTTVFNFIKTPFKTDSGQPLYMVEGSFAGEGQIWGASIELIRGKEYLVWYGNKGRFDTEYNMILKDSPTEISLGGDSEEY